MKQTTNIMSLGPGRRSDRPVRELGLVLADEETGTLARLAAWHSGLRFDRGQIDLTVLAPSLPATLFAAAALALQNAAGHRVTEVGLVTQSHNACRFWFEYEEPETAEQVVELVLELLTALLRQESADSNWARRIDQFLIRARARAMPADVQAIAAAAERRGTPVLRMDRPPYDPIQGPFRLRPNGLLRLGHGCRQQTVDGTFAVSRSEAAFPLVRDRAELFKRMSELNLPLPEAAADWQQSPSRAGRQAGQLGYPVIVRSDRRGAGFRHAQPCHSREQVAQMSTLALESGQKVLVQRQVPGLAYQLIYSGGRFLACLVEVEEAGHRRWRRFEGLHESIPRLGQALAASLEVGLLQLTVVTPDPAVPLAEAGGAVVDADPAARLDFFFAPGHPVLDEAAEAFIDWLIPESADSRIPIVAVTGTNGKTTTTRMLAGIVAAAGLSAGEAGSEGCWVGGKKVSDHEDGHIIGHLAVLDHPQTEFAVLETTRGAVATRGLGFARCDLAICLNITPDHFGDVVGLEHIDELAELKAAIVARAEQAVVLNADDPRCLALADAAGKRRLGLVSLEQSAQALLERVGENGAVAVLETIDGSEWLVVYQGQERLPLMAVEALPLAYDGSARFNLENALHAALAATLMGFESGVIARGLASLVTGYEGVPGRLSFREDLSFRVCMDYAHNPGGVRALSDFVDRQSVSGRRILCLAASCANTDELIRATAAAAAGHFDIYICKNFGLLYDRQPEENPRLLKEGLLRAGVKPEQIICILDEFEAFDHALDMGRPGDLVVLIGGKRRQELWDRVLAFRETE